jgi:flavorubredoxin
VTNSQAFSAVRISDKVYWVGAIDWNVRNFHGYETQRGTTYNAFLVLGRKVALFDAVKAPFKHELLSRIASVIDPGKIDYVISNHAELDHSGCLFDVVDEVKPEKVFASTMGVKALQAHFHRSTEITAVKEGETLDLGGLTATFLETRMLHWPDSMFTYLNEEKVLLSQDAFGMHLASIERFAEQLDDALLDAEGAKYYANILAPFSPVVGKLLTRLEKLGLPLETIAPDHGPVWGRKGPRILEHYRRWAQQKPTNKAVVVYDTMWNSTDVMARAVAEGIASADCRVELLPVGGNHRSDVATAALDAGALVLGSPTLNGGIMPTMADALSYLKGLKHRSLVTGGVFGSYGWSGESLKLLEAQLGDMGIESAGSVKATYVPGPEVLAECRGLGVKVAEALRAKLKAAQ